MMHMSLVSLYNGQSKSLMHCSSDGGKYCCQFLQHTQVAIEWWIAGACTNAA